MVKAKCLPLESKIKSEKYAAIVTSVISSKVVQVLQVPLDKIKVKLKKVKSETPTIELPAGAYEITESVAPIMTLDPPRAEGKFGGKISIESLGQCEATLKYKATIKIDSGEGDKTITTDVEYKVPGAYKVTK